MTQPDRLAYGTLTPMRGWRIVLMGSFFVGATIPARGASPAEPGRDVAPAARPRATAPAPAKPGSRKQRPRVLSEKEAEGSEAADRFESETVLKSRYSHEGQSLEVDPD